MKRFPLKYNDTVGIELEFSNIPIEQLETILNHLKEQKKIDENWTFSKEASVKDGGEIQSPIMNREQKWVKEVSIITETLKMMGAKTTSSCGFHIHFGGQILEKNTRYFQNMILLWCHKEKGFIEYTKEGKIRESLWTYARPLRYSLKHEEKEWLLLENIEYYEFLRKFQTHPFSKIYALNFQNLNYSMNTIEIRCPAGTLDIEKIHTYITLFHNFLEEAKKLTNEKRYQIVQELKQIPEYDRNSFEAIPYEKLYKKKL